MNNLSFKKTYFLGRILRSNIMPPPFPYKLIFALTYRCNLKCKTCFIWQRAPREELGIGEINNFFKNSNKFSWIHLTGGEIFLREDLLDIIETIFKYCKSLCLINIPTNGQVTGRIIGVMKKIMEHKTVVPVITVSIDGPPNIHDTTRGVHNSWYKAVDTLIALKELGLKHVYAGYTISQHNLGKLYNMFDSVKKRYPKLHYNDIHINFGHNSEHYFGNHSLCFSLEELIKEDLKKLMQGQRGIKAVLQKEYYNLLQKFTESKSAPVKCQAMSTYCFIDPYGNIYPCSIYNYKIANIKEVDYNINRLWKHSPVVQDARDRILNGCCPGCWTPCEAYPAMLGSLWKIGKDMIKYAGFR